MSINLTNSLARNKLLACGILLVAYLLLVWALPAKGLWADELYSIHLAEQPRLADAVYGTAVDVHPPLYYLVLWFWLRLTGFSDVSARYPAICAAILSIALTYSLGKHLFSEPIALKAILLLSLSPFFVLYSRMARYYTTALFLSILASWAYVQLLSGDKSRRMVTLYGLTAVALVYTDYPSGIFLLCHAFLALFSWKRDRNAVLRVLGSLVVAALLYLPWLPILIYQINYISGWTPAGFSLGLFGLLFKIGLPVFSFSVGETILPWHPPAILGAILVSGLWLAGCYKLLQTGRWQSYVILTLFIGPFLFIILFSIVIIYAFPSRVLAAAPFYFLVIAMGLQAVSTRLYRNLLLGGIILIYAFSNSNYFLNRQFINPTYAVPTRQIQTYIMQAFQTHDIIISEDDSGLDYYLRQTSRKQASFTNFEAAKRQIIHNDTKRVWLLKLGRDSTRSEATLSLSSWLEQNNFQLQWQQGYTEVDPAYRALKTRVLGYPAYQYRATLQLYTQSSRTLEK